MKEPVVEAKSLVKKYGELVAVAGIDFVVYSMESFGFLGPNGAGKSSTMNMITCYSPVTSGELRVFGLDIRTEARKIKSAVGVVPQETNLDPDLTVLENLLVYSGYFSIPKREAIKRADELLDFIGLREKKNEYVPELSGGMKRRLLIARALINRPKLLILDEPTTGLDPQSRHLVWERLETLKMRGITMIITTHYMDEAQRLCDRLMIIDRGKKVIEGVPLELVLKVVGEDVIELKGDVENFNMEAISNDGFVCEKWGNTIYIFGSDLKKLLSRFNNNYNVYLRKANLEDVYLKLTGRALREGEA
jgi:lipooligosaccharide transport system ATP-binding protein